MNYIVTVYYNKTCACPRPGLANSYNGLRWRLMTPTHLI